MRSIRERFERAAVAAAIVGCLAAQTARAVDANVRLTVDLDPNTVVTLEVASKRLVLISKDGEVVVTIRY